MMLNAYALNDNACLTPMGVTMVNLGKLFKNFRIGTWGIWPKRKMMIWRARHRMNCQTKMISKKILVFRLQILRDLRSTNNLATMKMVIVVVLSKITVVYDVICVENIYGLRTWKLYVVFIRNCGLWCC
jgi:hypothetical protein